MKLRPKTIIPSAILAIALLAYPGFAQVTGRWTVPLRQCWRTTIPNISSTNIASDNVNTVFIAKSSPSIQAYSAITGGLLWSVEFGGSLRSELRYSDGKLRFAALVDKEGGSSDILRIYEADPASGISRTTGEHVIPEGAVIGFDGERTYSLLPDGSLSSHSLEGTLLWSTDLEGGGFSGLSILPGLLAAFDPVGRILLISSVNGSQIGSFTLSSGASGAIAVSGDRLYAGTGDGYVFAIDLRKGDVVWRSRTGGSIDELTVVDRDVLVSSDDNFAYRLADGNGSRTWKRKLAGRIAGKAILEGGYCVFLSYGTEEAIMIRLSDGKIVNRFSASGSGYFPSGPVKMGEILILPLEDGLIAISNENGCEKK